MSIDFHCQACRKKIKAADDAGGKWGKCPYCSHKNYVPRPASPDDEELKLMPLDQSEETQYGSLMNESGELTKMILNETMVPEGDEDSLPEAHSERDIIRALIHYMRCMVDGHIERAEEYKKQASAAPEKTRDIIDRMMRTQSPEPELADIPPKVIQGYLKSLKAEI